MHVTVERLSPLSLKFQVVCTAIVERFLAVTIMTAAALVACSPASAQSAPVIIAPAAGNGTAGYSGDSGPASAAQLSSPASVAMDAAGNYYIADQGNHVIRKVTPAGVISTVAGNGSAVSSGDRGSALSAGIGNMRAIAVAPLGDILIVDGNVIRVVLAAGGSIFKVTIPSGPMRDSSCITGICIVLPLSGNVGLAADYGGDLYLADASANVVYHINYMMGSYFTFVGTGVPGYSGDGGDVRSAQLNAPEGVAVRDGILYIADTGNHVIRFTSVNTQPLNGVSIGTYAGTGTAGYSGDNGPFQQAQFDAPWAVAVDAALNVYVADANRAVIRKLSNASRLVTTVAGTGTQGYTGDWGPATSAELDFPSSIASDSRGNLYIPDPAHQVIRRIGVSSVTATPAFSPAPGSYTGTQTASITDATAGATIYYTTDGTTPTTSSSIYSGPITVGTTTTIQAIAVSPSYVQSAVASATYTISAAPRIITTVAGNGSSGWSGEGGAATSAAIGNPRAVAVDSSGNLFIADAQNGLIRKVNPSGFISTVVNDPFFGGAGSPGYSGDGGPAINARLNYPLGIAIDAVGDLYIADTHNQVVRKVTPDGNIQTVAGNGSSGYSGDGGSATNAEFRNPTGVAVDGSGNLYVADSLNKVVRKVDTAGNITTFAGVGFNYGNPGDDGPATSAQLVFPEAVAVDSAGNVYIGDSEALVVRKVGVDGVIHTVAGINGSYGNGGDGGPATSANLMNTGSLAVDASGNLYIGDYNAEVVRKVATDGTITTVAGNGTLGYSGDGGPATSATLNTPTGVAVSLSGNLYIADSNNHVIRAVGSGTALVPADTPQFDPPSGSYANAQSVTITDTTPGATIYYTTDGTTPTTSSSIYSGPITVSATETIHAIAVASGYFQSSVAAATYTIQTLITPLVEWSTPAPIAFGTPLSSVQLNASASVAGTFVYSPPAGTILTVGYKNLKATFTPADPLTYASATAGLNILVIPSNPGGPIITTVAGDATQFGYAGDGGAATGAVLWRPTGVSVDASGTMYIADTHNNVLRKVTPDGIISTIAGTGTAGYSGDGGGATLAQLNQPNGTALDSLGNVYFADRQNAVVRKISPAGIISTVAGNGTYGYAGDGGPAVSAELSTPTTIAIDGSNNLYIADFYNSVIRKVAPNGIISTFAGTGVAGFSGDGGPATIAELHYPEAVAVDGAGNVYIGDTLNMRVRKVDQDGNISTVAGNGIYGYTGDEGPATSAELSAIYALGVDAIGNIYVDDFDNCVVRLLTPDGTIHTFAGNGNPGFAGDGGPAQNAVLHYPMDITVAPSGDLFIADSYNNVIRKVAVGGIPTAATPTFSLASGIYNGPQSVTIASATAGATIYYTTDGSLPIPSASSNVYSGAISVTSTETIQAIAVAVGYSQSPVAVANFAIVAVPVTPVIRWVTPAPIVEGTALSATQLNATATVNGSDVSGMFVYTPPSGTLLSAGIHTISVNFTPADQVAYASAAASVSILVTPFGQVGPIITTVTGTGVKSYSGDGGLAVNAPLEDPFRVAVDNVGGLYILDSESSVVRKVTPDGVIATVAGTGVAGYSGDSGPATSAQLQYPYAIAVDPAGDLFISDGSNRVRMVNPAGIISTVAGNGSRGYSGDGGPATSAQIFFASDLVADASHNLYIADTSNSVVRKVDANGVITTVAGNGTYGYSGDGGPATQAALSSITGLAIDKSGNLYIADEGAHVVRKVDTNGIITTVAGSGTAGNSGDGGPATSAQMLAPRQPAIDAAGNLYVVDMANNVVRKVAPNGIITAFAGYGVLGYWGDGGPAVNAQLNNPFGIAVDSVGNLFIADTFNQRVRKVGVPTVASQTITFGPAPSVTLDGTGTLVASASSGLPVTFASTTPATCTVTGTTVQGVGYGPCIITADQSGNTSYSPAPQVSQVFPIGVPTITSVAPGSGKSGSQIVIVGFNFGAMPSAVSVTVNGSTVSATIVSGSDSSITAVVPDVPAGIASITVMSGYGIPSNHFAFTVLSSLPTITAVAPSSAKAGDQVIITGINFGTTPSLVQFLTADGSKATATIVSGSDTSATVTVPVIAPGADGIVVTSSSGINSNQFPFTVLTSAPTITAVAPAAAVGTQITISGVNFGTPSAVVFSTASGVAVPAKIVSGKDTSVTVVVPTIAAGAGSIVVTAGNGVNSNAYAFTVLLGTQTISFTSVGNLTYGAPQVQLQATSTSGLPVSFTATGPAMLSGSVLTVTGAGTITLTASQAGNASYAPAAAVTQTVNVSKASLTVTANDASRAFGAANPSFTYTLKGFVNGDSTSVVSGVATESSAATASSPAGTYAIYFVNEGLVATNYSFTYVNGTLTVQAGTQQAPQTPQIYPASGDYSARQTLVITDATAGVAIYYTTDGSTPTASSTPYSGPVVLAASQTVQAVAIANSLSSTVSTATYIINLGTTSANYPASGFTGQGLLLTGGAKIVQGALQLSDSRLSEARSAWLNTKVSVSNFTSDFTFQLTNAAADGFTFTLQNAGPNALGAAGGGLGYQGIARSVALKFDLYNNSGEGINSIGLYRNGAAPTVPATKLVGTGIDLHSGHIMAAHVTYDGSVLSLKLTDTVTRATFNKTFTVNIPSIVRGTTAYAGFTCGTGGLTASQNILSWSFTSNHETANATVAPVLIPGSGTYSGPVTVTMADATAGAAIYYTTDGSKPTASSTLYSGAITVNPDAVINAVAIASGYADSTVTTDTYLTSETTLVNYGLGAFQTTGLVLNNGAAVTGGVLSLTGGQSSVARSAWYATKLPVDSFTTDFSFQLLNAVQDGFTLTIQDTGTSALGRTGGGLGYQNIPRSVAIKFDLYDNAGEGSNSTGLYVNGAAPTAPSVNLQGSGIDLHSGNVIAAHIDYSGTALALTLTDQVTNSTFTQTFTIDIPTTIGASTAYVGFTAGTGKLSATQNILSWSFQH